VPILKRLAFVTLKGVSYEKQRGIVEDILRIVRIDYRGVNVGSESVLFVLSPRTLILCL